MESRLSSLFLYREVETSQLLLSNGWDYKSRKTNDSTLIQCFSHFYQHLTAVTAVFIQMSGKTMEKKHLKVPQNYFNFNFKLWNTVAVSWTCLKVKMHHGNQESVDFHGECNQCTCVAESDLQLSESGSESDWTTRGRLTPVDARRNRAQTCSL